MKDYITYKLEETDPVTEDLLRWLSVVTGIQIRPAKRGDADIYYGNSANGKKITIRKKKNDILWNDLINSKIENPLSPVVNFDIISAIGSLLSDDVNINRGEKAYDTHGRLRYNYSYQSEKNIEDAPLVNRYVEFLKILFSKSIGKKPRSYLPDGKRCTICLSHDVDKPILFQFLRDYRFNKNWSVKEKIYHTSRYLYNGGKYIFSSSKRKMSNIENIIVEEKMRGFKSTFYFASFNGYSGWGSIHDTFYNIEWPEFKPVFKTIKQNNFGIGLHASYNSYLSHDRLSQEKTHLENISEMEVIGLRHHYWHLGSDINKTLDNHSAAGFKYDSSTGFNDHIGFGRNCALPFYPVYSGAGKLINCLQIPVFCMDGSLLYKNNNVNTALETLKKYIDIIKQHNGTASVNWHTETSFRQDGKYKNWAEVYLKTLDYLSRDSEIWVTSLEDAYCNFINFEKQINKVSA